MLMQDVFRNQFGFFFTLRFLIYILERDICITSKESTFVSRHSREMLLFVLLLFSSLFAFQPFVLLQSGVRQV